MDQQIQSTPLNYHVTAVTHHSNIHLPTMPQHTPIMHHQTPLTPEMHPYTSLAPQLPPYCRTLYQTPADLNASSASSSGISSRDSPRSEPRYSSSEDGEDYVFPSESPDSFITSTTEEEDEEEILDVVNDDDTFVPSSAFLVRSLVNNIDNKPSYTDITTSASPVDLSGSFHAISDSNRTNPDPSYSSYTTPDLVRPFPTKRKFSDAFEDVDDRPSTEDGSPDGKSKKARTNYSKLQIDAFMTEFLENPYPDSERVDEMSRDLGVPESKIKVWFQNKRARSRGKVHTVPTLQAPIYPSPMYMPAMPHPFMTQQGLPGISGLPRTPIFPGTPGLPHYPMMYPTIFPHPAAAFAQQAAMFRHAYYSFPASPFQLASLKTSHLTLRSRFPSLPMN